MFAAIDRTAAGDRRPRSPSRAAYRDAAGDRRPARADGEVESAELDVPAGYRDFDEFWPTSPRRRPGGRSGSRRSTTSSARGRTRSFRQSASPSGAFALTGRAWAAAVSAHDGTRLQRLERRVRALHGAVLAPLAARFADFAGVRAGMRVLDVGAGTGALTDELVARPASATSRPLEPSPDYSSALRKRSPALDVRQAPAEELPWEDATLRQRACAARRDLPERRAGGGARAARVTARRRRRRRLHVGARRRRDDERPQRDAAPHGSECARPPRPSYRDEAVAARALRVRRLPRRRDDACSRSRSSTRRSTRSGSRRSTSAARAARRGRLLAGAACEGAAASRSCSGTRPAVTRSRGRAAAVRGVASARDGGALGAGADERHLDVELALDELDVAPRRLGQIVDRRAAVERLVPAGQHLVHGLSPRGSRSGARGSRASRRRRAVR